jgi:DNA repair protein RecN (Recombination protein N)
MLAALTVKDIVLIESASLEFARGLNVLTGETGAGKSILLDALGLAAGGRGGGRASVRPSASQGSASALFAPPADHAAYALLGEQAIAVHDGEVVLRRTLSSDGRTRAFVNDEPVGVALLKDVGAALLEIHGQTDDRGLFDAGTHRVLLDAFGGHEALAREVAQAFQAYDAARNAAADLRRAAQAAAADADYVRASAEELSALDSQDGEEAALASERVLLMNAAKIGADIAAASDALSGERGAEASLAAALKKLSRMNEEARKAATAAETALEQAFALTQEGRQQLDALLSRLELDPAELERKEDRLHALRAAARKFGVAPDQLPRLRAEFDAKASALGGGGDALKKADAAVAAAKSLYLDAARRLSKARATAAKSLEARVAEELAPLKLGHARFRVLRESLAEELAGAAGLERVAFELATVEGAAFGPLTKIASGGELARFSLALKVALAETSQPAALVFDEVDRGVGGAVADAVGERLQRLSRTTQVLLVTHSPQVAARAERHFRITRVGDKTRVHLLGDDERLEEIARMLSGAAVTAEARAAARRLLAEAGAVPMKKRKRHADCWPKPARCR